jgi:hypothetical protein
LNNTIIKKGNICINVTCFTNQINISKDKGGGCGKTGNKEMDGINFFFILSIKI